MRIKRKARPKKKPPIQEVFDLMGGVRRMHEWAKMYPGEFYRLYAQS